MRALLVANLVSVAGGGVSLVALPWFVLLTTGSPVATGLAAACEVLPLVAVAMVSGTVVDRLGAAATRIASDVISAVTVLAVPVLHATVGIAFWQLLVLVAVNGAVRAPAPAASLVLLHELCAAAGTSPDRARSTYTAGVRLAGALSAPLGGVLIGAWGAPAALVVDAASFAVSALFLGSIRRPERAPPSREDERRGMRAEITAGLAWVLRHPVLRVLLAANTIANVFLAMFQTLLVLYLVDGLALEAPLIGLVFAVGNVGAIAGAVVAGRVARRIGVGRAIALGLVGEGVSHALVVLAPVGDPVPLLVASALLFGLASVVFHVNALSLRQSVTEERLLGRMTATYRFASWGVIPIGSVAAGVLGSSIGLAPALLVSAAGGILSALPIVLSRVMSLRAVASPTLAEA